MDFQCKRCQLPLGGMEKGKIRNGIAMLCSKCWAKAESAMDMAELVASQKSDLFSGTKNPMDGDKVVQDIMGIFGMKGKKL